MFIAILTYKKPLEEVDRYLQAHREYLAEHYAVGDFIASGPQTPRIGGVIMMKGENRTALDTIIAQNPFKIKELPDENFGIGGKSIDEIKRNYNP